MQLALICDDPLILSWLDALQGDCGHDVVLAVVLTPSAAAVLRGRTGIQLTNRWEDLLLARQIDAVIVGGRDPEVLNAAKQLATAGQPMLFLPNPMQGSTFLYELNLIRDENRVKLCPAMTHRRDKAMIRLRQLIDTRALGTTRQLQFERKVFVESTATKLSQETVDAALLGDLDVLRWLGGNYDQVAAIRTGAAEGAVCMQMVTLGGRGLAEATWHIQSTDSTEVCRLTIHSDTGRTVIERASETSEWILTAVTGETTVGSRATAVRQLLDEFGESLASDIVPIEWSDLVQVFETLDATQRSVNRRRTIELHFEPMSERSTFKTQMTAMGCGVLVATLFLMLIYLAIASLVPLPNVAPPAAIPRRFPVATQGLPVDEGFVRMALHVARVLVFAPLAIFLSLQLLYPLTRPARANKTPEKCSDTERSQNA
jgi:predicted dehydrogenase